MLIPAQLPGLLDALARSESGELTVTVAGADAAERHVVEVDPGALGGGGVAVRRPRFVAVVSSATLAAAVDDTLEVRNDPAASPTPKDAGVCATD